MDIEIKGFDTNVIGYRLYLDECEYYDEEPLSYEEWLASEEYEQEMIDRMYMTDDEIYGEDY